MLHYLPSAASEWFAVVHADLALLVWCDDDSRIDEYFAAVGGGDIRAVLDVLTVYGISATPAFALVDSSSPTAHLFVRGECAVTVTSTSGETVEASGAGVSTWTERFVEGAASFVLDAGSEPATALPLVSGVVRSTRLVSGETAETAETAATPANPVVIEKPAPQIAPPPVMPPSLPAENTIVAPAEPAAEVPTESASDASNSANYDRLFEETIVRSVADAAVLPPADEPDEPEPSVEQPVEQPVERPGDHDGETVLSENVAKLLAGRKRETPPAAAPSAGPSLFLQLRDGTREPLGQPVILGRSPSVSKVSGANIPRLVTLTGDDDISRNHVQVTVEGGTVVVTDLHSRNGTWVIAPGKPPQQLRKGEATAVLVGTIIDLGNGSTLLVGQD